MAAIRYGYDLTDEEIVRLAAAAPPSRFQMNTAATAETHERTISAGHGVAAGDAAGLSRWARGIPRSMPGSIGTRTR